MVYRLNNYITNKWETFIEIVIADVCPIQTDSVIRMTTSWICQLHHLVVTTRINASTADLSLEQCVYIITQQKLEVSSAERTVKLLQMYDQCLSHLNKIYLLTYMLAPITGMFPMRD